MPYIRKRGRVVTAGLSSSAGPILLKRCLCSWPMKPGGRVKWPPRAVRGKRPGGIAGFGLPPQTVACAKRESGSGFAKQ
jgi:hypothetical protein